MHEWISRTHIIYINQQENQFHSKINIVMGYEQKGHRKYKWSIRKNDEFYLK